MRQMRLVKKAQAEYIKALVETRESENLDIFRNFMTEMMIRHLTHDIAAFEESIGENTVEKVKLSTADRIVSLIKENPRHSAKSLAEAIGISAKGIEKQLAKLKAQGVLQRIGPDKGGSWEVFDI